MPAWVQCLTPQARRLIRYWVALDHNPNHDPNNGQFTSGVSFTDATEEYKRGAHPWQGTFMIEPGVDYDRQHDEIAIAQWLHSELGGDITVLRERYENKGEPNPDFLWRGALWDLKTPDKATFNAMNKRTQTGLHQIAEKPGGVILDLRLCGATIEEAERAIISRMRTSGKFPADIMILVHSKEYKVLRFNNKK